MLLATLPSPLTQDQSRGYRRRPPLILINGMAEQAESWFCNLPVWRQHFEVYLPNLLVYEGTALHRRIAEGLPINIDYLVAQLHRYLEEFVQTPPFHLVANSLGGKIAVEYAARYPEQVDRLVLLCPSGLSEEESLPLVDGVRRSDPQSLASSVFHDARRLDTGIVDYYSRQFANRRWRTGLLRTIRGTMEHRVRDRLADVKQPTLLVVGREDRIVATDESIEAALLLPQGRLHVLEHCGHAPQMEQPEAINRLVVDFLTQPLQPMNQADRRSLPSALPCTVS